MTRYKLITPFPPSVNHYWYHANGKHFITQKGKQYRTAVVAEIVRQKLCKRLSSRIGVMVLVYPPDRRKRDLDNLMKAPLDAITHGEMIEDDSLIDELTIKRREVIKGGKLEITIWEIEDAS